MIACRKIGCELEAVCAVGIALYPFAAFMKLNNNDRPLTRLILSLTLCDAHFADVERDGAQALMGSGFDGLVRSVEKGGGVSIDIAATKLVRVAFTEPDYLVLLKARKDNASP